MRDVRVRVVPFVVSLLLVTGVASTVGVAVSPSPALADVPSADNEASVASQPLAPAPVPVAEGSGSALPVPVWPSGVEASAALSGMAAGALTPGSPAGASVSVASSVVRVGPAASGVSGPLQPAGAVSAPSTVDVRVLDRTAITAAGGQALGVVVNRADGVASAGAVRLSVSYAGFAQAFGGDFAGRLRLVEFPVCAVTTPLVEACRVPTYVSVVNDRVAHTLTGTVDANPDPVAVGSAGGSVLSAAGAPVVSDGSLVTVMASGSSDAGDYRATDLHPSGAWDVSVASGAFTYSVPVVLPPPAEGSAPDLSFGYNSQVADGMTSATNNQASQEGLGWSLSSAYVQRRYRSCADDGVSSPSGEGDLCWYSPYAGTGGGHAGDSIYEIVLNGQSSPLVPDASVAGQFHLTDDPGWLVQHHTGASNGDDDGEWWQVFTPDGSIYDLGIGTDAKTGAATGSVLTEPVFGNDSGEPCNGSWASHAPCVQGWRWMLDQVWDPNEVATSYHYSKESNAYRSILGTDEARTYDMAADLTEIDYGWASQLSGTNYTDKVTLSYVQRCLTRMSETDPLRNTVPSCPSYNTTPSDFPDVPLDKVCTAADGDTSGCASPVTSYSPVFFSLDMLWGINTYTLTTTGAATQVMRYQPKYDLPDDGSGAFLWLDYLQRQGLSGTGGSVVLPVINFNGAGSGDLDNVVGATTLKFRRISTVDTDLGGSSR